MGKDSNSQAPHFSGKVRKFIIIPICTVEDQDGNPIREERMGAIPAFVGNLPDLKSVAKQLEDKVNGDYFSRLNAKARDVIKKAQHR